MTHSSIQHGQQTQVVSLLISFCSLHQHNPDRIFTVSSGTNLTTALATDADISSTDCPVFRRAHGKRHAGPDQRAEVVLGARCATSVPPSQRCLRQLAYPRCAAHSVCDLASQPRSRPLQCGLHTLHTWCQVHENSPRAGEGCVASTV